MVDVGSRMFKCGFAGDETPRAVFPSIVGRPRESSSRSGRKKEKERDTYVGDEAFVRSDILSLRNRFRDGNGAINWDDVEKLMFHALYNELRVDPGSHPILLSEPPLCPKEHREKMTKLMFETFKCPAVYLASQAVLSLFGTGRTTGVVVDCGEKATFSVPIYQGHSLDHGVLSIDLAGRGLTDRMVNLVNEKGHSFGTRSDREMIRNMKERECFVSLDFDHDSMIASSSDVFKTVFPLSEDQTIPLNEERFLCPEVLFQPSLVGMECNGIHKMTMDSISRCDVEIRDVLSHNLILSGGSTMFPGFVDRFQRK